MPLSGEERTEAIINSYIDNITEWTATKNISASTPATTSVTLGTGNYYSFKTTTTNYDCAIGSPLTLNFSGTGSGGTNVYVSIDPFTHVELTCWSTGITVSGSGFTVSYSASPGWPVDGSGNYTQLNWASGTWSGSAISWGDIPGPPMPKNAPGTTSESASGIYMSDGPGPFETEQFSKWHEHHRRVQR